MLLLADTQGFYANVLGLGCDMTPDHSGIPGAWVNVGEVNDHHWRQAAIAGGQGPGQDRRGRRCAVADVETRAELDRLGVKT
jgi:hypothetical protein